jgi:hypothetical protein
MELTRPCTRVWVHLQLHAPSYLTTFALVRNGFHDQGRRWWRSSELYLSELHNTPLNFSFTTTTPAGLLTLSFVMSGTDAAQFLPPPPIALQSVANCSAGAIFDVMDWTTVYLAFLVTTLAMQLAIPSLKPEN